MIFIPQCAQCHSVEKGGRIKSPQSVWMEDRPGHWILSHGCHREHRCHLWRGYTDE